MIKEAEKYINQQFKLVEDLTVEQVDEDGNFTDKYKIYKAGSLWVVDGEQHWYTGDFEIILQKKYGLCWVGLALETFYRHFKSAPRRRKNES